MGSDIDEKKYYASADTEDKEEPRLQPPSPDFLASKSDDENDVGNVVGQQP
jgi:hypothetical protein